MAYPSSTALGPYSATSPPLTATFPPLEYAELLRSRIDTFMVPPCTDRPPPSADRLPSSSIRPWSSVRSDPPTTATAPP